MAKVNTLSNFGWENEMAHTASGWPTKMVASAEEILDAGIIRVNVDYMKEFEVRQNLEPVRPTPVIT